MKKLKLVIGTFAALLIVSSLYLHLFSPDYAGIFLKKEETEEKVKTKYEGRELYIKYNCSTCHGSGGKNPQTPMYPRINSQPFDYTIAQLRDIKSGARANGMSSVMKPHLENISDEDMVKIARYLESSR